MTQPASVPLPIVILISGRGSNLQSIIDCAASGALSVEIRAVISNRPDAGGLEIASAAGITTEILDHSVYADRQSFDKALLARIDHYQPGLLVLAGFMRLLTDDFVAHYHGRMLNIHPSLLPQLPGLNTHRRAIEDGHNEHGASVHFVTPDMDGGPVLLQAHVPIRPDDDPDSLAARVLTQEHRLYPLAIQWFAEQRIFLDEHGRIVFDGQPLLHPRDLSMENALPC
jgi:phosphoribosylglycinamide formyltransferase-1